MGKKFKKGDIAYIKKGNNPIGWDSHRVEILERVIVKKGNLRRVAYKIKYLDGQYRYDSVARPNELYSVEQLRKSTKEVGKMFKKENEERIPTKKVECPNCGKDMKRTLSGSYFCYNCRNEIHDYDLM